MHRIDLMQREQATAIFHINRRLEKKVSLACIMYFLSYPQIPNIQFCQTPGEVFRLGVDFVLPLSQEQEQEQQEEEPTPKSIRRGCTRRLKFDT